MHETNFIARGQKTDRHYAPSFDFDGVVDENQPAVHEQVAAVDGWLEPEDSLKLYELGYLAPGPFLEIGTYRGKSATVLATALRDAGRYVQFYSLDIDRQALESAGATLAARGLGRYVTLVHGSVTALVRAVPALEPRFVFLDGDHSAEGLGRDLATLEHRLPASSLLLFHDFVDARNDDPADKAYGVTRAIAESWVARDCEFAGTFGCTGLYRRVRGPAPGQDGDHAPPLLQLVRLDRLSVRVLVDVLRPGKRFVMRTLRLGGRSRGDRA